MLFRFCADIQALMTAKGFPVQVKHGPERVSREYGRGHVIVIENDPEKGDTIEGALGLRQNPQKVRARYVGAKATIYARSSVASAHQGNHEEEAYRLLDGLVCAMYKWGSEGKVGDLPISKAGFVTQEKIPDIERWPGAVYEIRFMVGQGIHDRTYAGEASPTGKATGVQNNTQAHLLSGDSETGCGG